MRGLSPQHFGHLFRAMDRTGPREDRQIITPDQLRAALAAGE